MKKRFTERSKVPKHHVSPMNISFWPAYLRVETSHIRTVKDHYNIIMQIILMLYAEKLLANAKHHWLKHALINMKTKKEQSEGSH